MGYLPTEVKLTKHARQRLEERASSNIQYNTKNLMKTPCKWYNKEDFPKDSAIYLHILYVCRKSNQLSYVTNGDIEVIFNKNSKNAISILAVKDKFKPITQFVIDNNMKEGN